MKYFAVLCALVGALLSGGVLRIEAQEVHRFVTNATPNEVVEVLVSPEGARQVSRVQTGGFSQGYTGHSAAVRFAGGVVVANNAWSAPSVSYVSSSGKTSYLDIGAGKPLAVAATGEVALHVVMWVGPELYLATYGPSLVVARVTHLPSQTPPWGDFRIAGPQACHCEFGTHATSSGRNLVVADTATGLVWVAYLDSAGLPVRVKQYWIHDPNGIALSGGELFVSHANLDAAVSRYRVAANPYTQRSPLQLLDRVVGPEVVGGTSDLAVVDFKGKKFGIATTPDHGDLGFFQFLPDPLQYGGGLAGSGAFELSWSTGTGNLLGLSRRGELFLVNFTEPDGLRHTQSLGLVLPPESTFVR